MTTLNNIAVYLLIIDDDADDHFLLRKAIDATIPQAIVESLYDGSEALQFLENCTTLPNLVFLDLNMPVVSGTSTIKLIREKDYLKDLPIIVLTTSNSERDRTESMKLGASDFYSKPFNQHDLVKIVEEVKEKWLK
ncbi:MAG: response regulator [Bacteroidia bacterium]|nr:response regulator [Bacteroidia bacterium]